MTKKTIAVMDCETDPFAYNFVIQPFVIGFYDGTDFLYFWGDDCRDQFVTHLAAIKRPLMIYVHNGGKFDMMFFLRYLEDKLHIQNNRIVQCWIGQHEFRDSYSILPIPLKQFKGKHQKQEWTNADYLKYMARENRNKFKRKIVTYLEDDCLTLHDGVIEFRKEFGNKLTIGSTSMRELKRFHAFEVGGQEYDTLFRPYYFGGRNQCFKSGIIDGDYKVFDVNSMYPFVMQTYLHPVSVRYDVDDKINKRTTFARIDANNDGCLPIRTQTGLDFTCEKGLFYASIHEIRAGEETGTLKINRVIETIEHKRTATFQDFVEHFYAKRLKARALGQEMLVTFYKLVLNSAYGKFAQNPDNYKDYRITQGEAIAGACEPYCPADCPYHWRLSYTDGEFFIWEKPSERKSYFNVATAASITAASRAVLLRGLTNAVDPVYCDTDSIIARELNLEIDAAKLGAWKPEANGTSVAIAGKKLYAVFNGVEAVKQASKGAIVSAETIRDIARGSIVKVENPVPHFKLDGHVGFVHRTLRNTTQGISQFRR